MDIKKSKRLILALFAVYWLFAAGIYAIANEQFRYSKEVGQAPEQEYIIGEIVDGMQIRQPIVASADVVTGIEILADTYGRDNTGTVNLSLSDMDGEILTQLTVEATDFVNCQYTFFPFAQETAVSDGETLVLTLTTDGCESGNAITVYAGRTIADAAKPEMTGLEGEFFENGYLCVRLNGYRNLSFYKTYWIIVAVASVLIALYTNICWKAALQGKSNPLVSLLTVYGRYSFLIKQLVSRDFKTKYKRSALGMAWSILNPLLTMAVQYIVFSTLFNSDIPNYPVYLLTGIVFMNFFNEAISLGMTSITGNASLIKKVYMPKYIYPLSRTMSSLINFVLALVPLFGVIIVTRTAITPAMLLLVFNIVCFLGFVIGMTLLLTTAMTFFQDTQFLWGVVSMMWQYLTPIFYPETIIPAAMLPIYRMNPMYQFISFARTCIIEGISPAPMAYFGCLASAAVSLLAGILVFKKFQNKFVMYL